MSQNTVPVPQRGNEYFDRMRQEKDPLADSVVDELFREGTIENVNLVMRTLVANDGIDSAEFPPQVAKFLQDTSKWPTWADPARIENGQQLFWRYGPKIIAILHCYSLPFCYAAEKGVQVLALTGRLSSNPTRRIIETAQMVVDVLSPGGMDPGSGKGILTAQKVRLMHAAVRRLTLQSGRWNPDWDQPINQEDLVGTLLSFSWVVLDGLQKLGIEVTGAEAEDYQHCWNVVGYILGIREELLPQSAKEAGELASSIKSRLYANCKEGEEMTAALVGMMTHIVPGDAFDFAPAALIRYLMGEEDAALIGVHPNALSGLLQHPARLLIRGGSKTLQGVGYYGPLSETFSRLLIVGLIHVMRQGNRPSFQIPQVLRQRWGIEWTS
ncbi:hypothetical protein F183_A29540 [Bryobacterales bacterium F-183]|nr:hypothetical protein F183_A29540 [Bryobacterales bacterium F-183]